MLRQLSQKSLQSNRHGLLLCLLAWLALAPAGAVAAGVPQAELDNGVLHVTFDLPDAANGFYRGTRFDWSGVIASLTFAGHSYYGPWFTKIDPPTRDFIFSGPDIIAGKESAITGPVEEFVKEDNSTLGFAEAKPGQTFVKIGVGVLRKPDDRRYSPYRDYELVDGGTWKVRARKTSVEFTQRLVDKASGYGYRYTKVVRLVSGQPRMVIEHTLKNLGRLPIQTDVYDHNFLVLDHQPIGPDLSLTMPFALHPDRPVRANLGAVEGNRILYLTQLQDRETFAVNFSGLGKDPASNSAKDNDIRVENARVGAGVQITGDHPLDSIALWSIRSVLGIEPFIQLKAVPGETIHWSYFYRYYILPQKN